MLPIKKKKKVLKFCLECFDQNLSLGIIFPLGYGLIEESIIITSILHSMWITNFPIIIDWLVHWFTMLPLSYIKFPYTLILFLCLYSVPLVCSSLHSYTLSFPQLSKFCFLVGPAPLQLILFQICLILAFAFCSSILTLKTACLVPWNTLVRFLLKYTDSFA